MKSEQPNVTVPINDNSKNLHQNVHSTGFNIFQHANTCKLYTNIPECIQSHIHKHI